MKKITSKIVDINGLWMVVENPNRDDNCAWAIVEEEIPAILKACQDYIRANDVARLKKKYPKEMKDVKS